MNMEIDMYIESKKELLELVLQFIEYKILGAFYKRFRI